MARDPAFHTLTTSASVLASMPPVLPPVDALFNPSNDDMLGAALTFWPSGPAWGSPDGEAVSLSAVLARLTRVLVSPFEWLYARAFTLTMAATPAAAGELLPEWEADYGLPDDCIQTEGSVAERIRALEAKVSGVATITPEDFIRLGAFYGFEIQIEEPCMFECGFSECGGEHETGDVRQEIYWNVYVADLAVDYFRVSESECGLDPLFDYGNAEKLLCILRRLSPGWTIPLLSEDAFAPPFDPPEGHAWLYLAGTYPRRYVTYGGTYVSHPLPS